MRPSLSAITACGQNAVGRNGLVAELLAQIAESAKLKQVIKANLRGLGYGW